MFGMFDNGQKSSGGSKVKNFSLLEAVVDSSMATVEIGTLTSKILSSSKHIDDLVSSTASASAEMVSTVKGIADSSGHAAESARKMEGEAKEASATINQVNTDMETTLVSMNNLREASAEIQNVVGSISDITDQTNLLALNAAIEAARAGEAGRGFSVVADEVRKLSNQSQDATAQITDTIKRIQHDIQEVVEAVEGSAGSIKEGVDKVESLRQSSDEIVGLMNSIAASTQEQSIASEQVSESILQVSEESQHNNEQGSSIMIMIDELVATIETQRAIMSEMEIPNKVVVLAQADHALWKKKIVDFQMGRITLSPEDAGDHTTCRLGKWYYGGGKKEYGNNQIFKDMDAHHAHVHDAAREAAQRRATDPNADITDLVTKLDDASVHVVNGLKELIK